MAKTITGRMPIYANMRKKKNKIRSWSLILKIHFKQLSTVHKYIEVTGSNDYQGLLFLFFFFQPEQARNRKITKYDTAVRETIK